MAGLTEVIIRKWNDNDLDSYLSFPGPINFFIFVFDGEDQE
jgi:hypothetical protein